MLKDWKERLIKCGMTEPMAQRIVDYFFKRRRTFELMQYVKLTEEATGKCT